MIQILGFDCKPKDAGELISRLQSRFQISCQLLDVNKVPGSKYLLHATVNAVRAFESGQRISRTLGMQILLYAAANKQIGQALAQVGVTKSTTQIAAILVGDEEQNVEHAASSFEESLPCRDQDEILDHWTPLRLRNVNSIFGIERREVSAVIRKGEKKVEAIERLAIERSALLAFKG